MKIAISSLMPWRLATVSATLVLALASGCAPEFEPYGYDAGEANFSRTIAIGGTVLSGYQDGALSAEGQRQSIAALIARSVVAAGDAEFEQPLIPGTLSLGLHPWPWVAPYQTNSRLGDVTDCNGEVSLGPVKTALSDADLSGSPIWDAVPGPLMDFTVPGMDLWAMDRVYQASDRSEGGAAVYASRLPMVAEGKSLLQAAVAANPSFVIMWPGMDDVWNYASKGAAYGTLATPAAFEARLDSVLGALTAGGAKGVLATIPDPVTMPFFTTVPPRALELSQGGADSLNDFYALGNINLDFQAGENGFVIQDAASQYGIRQLTADEMILLSVPLDSMKCYYMGVLFTLIPNRCSLIADELASIRATIDGYNTVIRAKAQQYDLALAEMADFYGKVHAGLRYEAVDFSSEFAAGGFFGLDGYGPTPKGAGLIANEFLKAIMDKYSANLPLLQVDDLDGVLFP